MPKSTEISSLFTAYFGKIDAQKCLRIIYLSLLIVSETILGDRWSEAGTGRSNSSHSLERGALTGQDRKIVTKLGILFYRGTL